jgi:amino acid permease
MISLLNLAGAVFSLPNRFWLPGLVNHHCPYATNLKSFACAWLYTFSYGVALADKAVAFRIYMFYWIPHVPYPVWILIFFIFPVLFNLLNVRRMGEIEFSMTVVKVITLLAIIVFGIVVIGRGTPYLRGLDDSYKPVPCHNNNVTANCTSGPGFDRLNFANES